MSIKRKIPLIVIVATFVCFSVLFATEKDFKEKRSTHFIVYYKDGVDINFINDIIESSERYYEEIADNLGFHRYKFWLWDERAKIYIFLDKSSYQKETNQPEWSGGCADYRRKKLWTYPHASGFFDSILPHELGHIIFREFVGFGKNIPLWFDEGIAGYQERSKRYASKNMVKDLMAKDKLLTLDQLSEIKTPHGIDKELAEAFYAQTVSITYFLVNSFGRDRFVTFCRRLKKNVSLNKSLDRTYYNFKGTKDLYKKWLEYINEK